jgi:hypothetical protein
LITTAAFNEHARNFILRRALDHLDIRELVGLIDEVDETFYGTRPDLTGLIGKIRDENS